MLAKHPSAKDHEINLLKALIATFKNRAACSYFRWSVFYLGKYIIIWIGRSAKARPLHIVSARETACSFLPGPDPARYHRRPPDIRNAPPALRRQLDGVLQTSPVASCGAEIAVMRNAVVAASGIVLSSDGRVVRETLDGTTKWQRFFPFCRDRAGVIQIDIRGRFSLMKRVDGMAAVLLRSAFDSNYGHWLVECLPKLDEVSRHFKLGDCYVLVSAGYDHMGKVFHESLGLLGIPTCRILELTYAPVSFETLVYPLPITSHPWTKSPAIIEFLERLGARVPRDPSAPRRIFVSRKLAHQRRLQNEQDVLDVVQLHGFQVIYPETLSLTEQIRLLSAAEIVIGPCGAGLTNLVFSPRGVVVLALTAEWMQDDFFWDLTDLKDGQYCSLHGRSLGAAGDYNADFEIDIAAFHPAFESCLGKLPRAEPFCN